MAALFCAVLWKRAQFKRKQRRGEISPRARRTGVRIGNALQVLEEFVHPHTRHVFQERLEQQEDTQQDEDTTSDPTEHLLRQARRIQRGDTVEQVTALWRPPDRS